MDLPNKRTKVNLVIGKKYFRRYVFPKWILHKALKKGKVKVFGCSIVSDRIKTFIRSTTCVSCGVKGTFCAIEQDLKMYKHYKGESSWHINVYGEDALGNEIMITSDHIVPKKLGGCNCMENRQPMCELCNSLKGHNLWIPGVREPIRTAGRKRNVLKFPAKETVT